ncbi:MAG: DUF3379 family protein [Aquabacterium sp.]
MNCAQTRRSVLTDPHRLPDDVKTHLAQCAACQSVLQRQRKQQAHIARVVASTPTPGLRPIVFPMPDAVNAAAAQPTRRHLMAAAASVALGFTGALGAGIWWRKQGLAPDAAHWAEVIIQHFQEDPTHLLPPDPRAALEAPALLTRLGARQIAALPPVIHGGMCQLLDCEAAHLVLQWQGQRVVAFLVPRKGQTVLPLSVDGWQGELRPLVGGMVATLARAPSVAKSAAQVLASAVAWSN